jgi:hypothetical protein
MGEGDRLPGSLSMTGAYGFPGARPTSRTLAQRPPLPSGSGRCSRPLECGVLSSAWSDPGQALGFREGASRGSWM